MLKRGKTEAELLQGCIDTYKNKRGCLPLTKNKKQLHKLIMPLCHRSYIRKTKETKEKQGYKPNKNRDTNQRKTGIQTKEKQGYKPKKNRNTN